MTGAAIAGVSSYNGRQDEILILLVGNNLSENDANELLSGLEVAVNNVTPVYGQRYLDEDPRDTCMRLMTMDGHVSPRQLEDAVRQACREYDVIPLIIKPKQPTYIALEQKVENGAGRLGDHVKYVHQWAA